MNIALFKLKDDLKKRRVKGITRMVTYKNKICVFSRAKFIDLNTAGLSLCCPSPDSTGLNTDGS